MTRRVLIGAVALSAGLIAATSVVVATSGDPLRAVTLSPGDAADKVRSFVGSMDGTASLNVRGPVDGAYDRAYEVDGAGIIAMVDAHTGAIVTLVLDPPQVGASALSVDAQSAKITGEQFLQDHDVSANGLQESVQFMDHGETSEYVVTWTRYVGNVVAPDFKLVGISTDSGQVFRYVDMERPFADPEPPHFDENAATAIATELVSADANARLDKTELKIAFSDTGAQRLVWDIYISDTVGVTVSGQTIPGHWVVEVDAETGSATVVASS